MPTFRFMHVPKSFWLVLALFVVAQASAQEDATSAPNGSSFERFGQSYIDANLGLAFLDEGLIPGASFLVGRRSFHSESTFLDAEIGLAFPLVATAKFGVGRYKPATGRSVSVGIRPWPAHVFVQFGRDNNRCSDDAKPWVARRLKRRGKDSSDIMCGESIVSIEASAYLIESLIWSDFGFFQYRFDSASRDLSMWSVFMFTWSHRWYLH